MENITNPLIENSVQCWACPVFDSLFQIVSNIAAAVYDKFVMFAIMLFCVLLIFYILNIVWKNLKDGVPDPSYQKYIKPLLINSLLVFAILGTGVFFPRLITQITIEPVTQVATLYTTAITQTTVADINDMVVYEPMKIETAGFFRTELRDNIILMAKTTISQFQGYIKLGIAIMDKAFSWSALLGIGELLKHIILFFIGLFFTYNFFLIFFRFTFFFMDIILAAALFAFFFPISLIGFIFKNSEAPDWMKNIGGDLGAGQIKQLIQAVISLAVAVLTYTIIIIIFAKFFSTQEISTTQLMELITTGQIFANHLGDDNMAAITITSALVLLFIIKYIIAQIPEITKSITDSIGIGGDNSSLSAETSKNVMRLTELAYNKVKEAVIPPKPAKDEKK